MKWERLHGDGECTTDELVIPEGGRLIRVTMQARGGRGGSVGLAWVPDQEPSEMVEVAEAKAQPEQEEDTAPEASMTSSPDAGEVQSMAAHPRAPEASMPSGIPNPYVPETGSPYETGEAAKSLPRADQQRSLDEVYTGQGGPGQERETEDGAEGEAEEPRDADMTGPPSGAMLTNS